MTLKKCLVSPDEQAWQAHRRYVASGALVKELLREPVFRAWVRCHELKASAQRMEAVQLDLRALEHLLTREQRLLAAARPYMRALSHAAAGERHAAMLGDARGVVIDVVGDPMSILGPERVPGPGSLLSEGLCGANGIGTPLAEGGYASLVGPEHFIAGFHPFTCQGVPIRDPDGAIAGVISVSVRRVEAAERLRELLVCAAHGIGAELIRGRLDDDVRLLVASGGREDEPLLEQLRQDIVQSQATARLEVSIAARDLAKDRLEYAMRLLSLAQKSIAEFSRRSALWRGLASEACAAPEVVDVAGMLRDLGALLRTEAATGRVTLEVDAAEPLHVEADRLALARNLFRGFLRAFDGARGGGTVRVALVRRVDGPCDLLLHTEPAPGAGREGPRALVLPIGPATREPPCC